MITRIALLLIVTLALANCNAGCFTKNDYQSVLKVDSHVHLNSDKGYFEDQAIRDNFMLITLAVDHSDSVSVKQQLSYALLSAKKYPGKVFYGVTFYFDTVNWETDDWS